MHSTFHRKMGLKCAGVEGGRARENTGLQKPVKQVSKTFFIYNVEGCRDGSAKKCSKQGSIHAAK